MADKKTQIKEVVENLKQMQELSADKELSVYSRRMSIWSGDENKRILKAVQGYFESISHTTLERSTICIQIQSVGCFILPVKWTRDCAVKV